MQLLRPYLALVMLVGCGEVNEVHLDALPSDSAVETCPNGPTAEICDGEDNDCNDTIDDGCPKIGATASGATTQLALAGGTATFGTANTAFTLRCMPGDAIVGFKTGADDSIGPLGIICAHVRIESDAVIGTQRTFTVVTTDPVTSTIYGSANGSTTPMTDSVCESGVAIATAIWDAEYMTNGKSIFGLSYTCSRLEISGLVGDTRLRATGTPVESPRIAIGNTAVTEVRRNAACAAGSVLTGVTGYYGPWPLYSAYTIINGLQFECSEVTAILE
jgi:hypothetical protein